jgi:hypothetical protein
MGFPYDYGYRDSIIEPWHVSWRLRADRDLKTRPREPTPPSDYIPLGGVVLLGRLSWRRNKSRSASPGEFGTKLPESNPALTILLISAGCSRVVERTFYNHTVPPNWLVGNEARPGMLNLDHRHAR